MDQLYNGIPASELPATRWRKSRYSTSQGNCVEFARLPDGRIAIRNSQHPSGPALIYNPAEIFALIRGVKDGDLDDLVV